MQPFKVGLVKGPGWCQLADRPDFLLGAWRRGVNRAMSEWR